MCSKSLLKSKENVWIYIVDHTVPVWGVVLHDVNVQ